MSDRVDAPGRPDHGVARRLFFTCWLVYSVHVATNMVRENYLALAIGDHASFRVDEYAGMHDDIFEHPGYGWHIGSNPGASMVAAIPYALARPVIDPIVSAVQARRAQSGATVPPDYAAPTATDRRFYEEAWRRGYDIKFGLASVVMQALGMAVISALGVVLMYLVMAGWLGRPRAALGLALLYGFGTPAFFRTGFVNHNMMMATVGLLGFAVLWRRGVGTAWRDTTRFAAAGLAGGLAVLLDYSGIVMLAILNGYGLATVLRAREQGVEPGIWPRLAKLQLSYGLGALGPLLLLWWYQWRSFGHPFTPPQHWMPPVEFIEQGYQGVSLPTLELAGLLAFDYRFGLFVSCPLFLLAIAAPWANSRTRARANEVSAALPRLELWTAAGMALGFFVFFSGVFYTRWQFNTGVRYLAPTFPFLFLLAVVVLRRLPAALTRTVGVLSVAMAWAMAMSRDVSGGKVDLADPDAGRGVLDPIIEVVTNGPQLPALTTLSRMEGYGLLSSGIVRPLPVLSVAAVVLFFVWRRPMSA